jgi:hypothetical protein
VDTSGFRFTKINALDDPDFFPGGAKYDDLPGILALSAPHPLWLAGEKEPPPVRAAYQAVGAGKNLTVFSGEENGKEMAAVEWLLQ